jgi:soluble lytic murein transglycosylase-like protein
MRNHFGNDRDAHIAYNWGPGNTEEWLSTGGNLENIPKETRDYLGKISNYGK